MCNGLPHLKDISIRYQSLGRRANKQLTFLVQFGSVASIYESPGDLKESVSIDEIAVLLLQDAMLGVRNGMGFCVSQFDDKNQTEEIVEEEKKRNIFKVR